MFDPSWNSVMHRIRKAELAAEGKCIRMSYQGDDYELVDDGGWYFQRWSDNKVSQRFLTQEDAQAALELDGKGCGTIDWR